MIKIQVEFSDLYNKLLVVNIKGIRSGVEWLTREVENALCFSCDGSITLDWGMVDIPPDLRKRVIITQVM